MISPGDDIADIIIHNLKTNKISIHNGDILTIAQKIISKSENRYRKLSNIKPTKKAKTVGDKISKDPRLVQAVLDESKKIVRYKKNVLIVEHKLGFIHANAGIDRSNIDQKNEQILLLPKDPDKSAACYQWLEDNGLGDIIKNNVGMSFGKGENQEAKLLEDTIKNLGFIPEVKVSVHRSTLKATVRQLIKDGKTVPDNMFSLFIGQKTKITKKK